MLARPLILFLIGLSVTCCTFNCLYHEATAAAYFARYSGPQSANDALAPVSPVDDEDESGCICRGAFFVEAPAVVPIDLARWCPLFEQSTPLEATFALEEPGEYLDTDNFLLRPPLAGRALRACRLIFVLSALSLTF